MRILPPVHHRQPFDHHAKQAPESFASRWTTNVPLFHMVDPSEVIHESFDKEPLHLTTLALGSMPDTTQTQQHPLDLPSVVPRLEDHPSESSDVVVTLWKDKGRRRDLRELGYSEKIVEKLTPYQVNWLHRYHIYNHADEIFHSSHSSESC